MSGRNRLKETLAGRVAIVTGASSGIGLATARELARRGARVALASRRAGELDEQTRAIVSGGGEAMAIPTDVAQAAQVVQLVERTREAFGPVDVVVNNAGVVWRQALVRSPVEEIAHVVDVNLLGAMLLTREALPGMLERRTGTIISVCSIAGRVAIEPLYSATKYGLRGFSLALRRQLINSGVSVSLVSPGHIRTEMTKDIEEPMAEPDIVADTIVGLVIRPRREVVIPKSVGAMAWLEQLLPNLSDLAFRRRHWSRVE